MVAKSSIIGLVAGLVVILIAVAVVGGGDSSDGVQTNTVTMVQGSGMDGCEKTSIGCYDPVKLTTYRNNVITWKNTDSSAHTVTIGTPQYGITGFDSGLIMSGNEFSHSFGTPGTYDYFCIVHPWMVGQVIVR